MPRRESRRIIAILIGVILIAGFIIGIPAFCQGFPTPVITQVKLTGVGSDTFGTPVFFVQSTVTNQGTDGYVVITTKLVNASRNSIEAQSRAVQYLKDGEIRTLSTTVKGPRG